MKQLYALLLLAFASLTLSAQTVQEFKGARPVLTTDGPEGVTITCMADTVRYFGWKASSLRFLSINSATSAQGLCQYYDCPQPITVHGMEFHGYAETGVVNAICQLYLAGPDSLPVGSALATDTVAVDSIYGSLTLADLSRVATFAAPVLVTQPYVIVYNNFTATNTVLVCNDWDVTDGDSEWMAGGDFRNLGGDWTRSYDMNVGGVVYNADALLNAIVTYDNESDFSADVTCLTGPATVTFTDYCSPIVTNRMYNQNVAAGIPSNTYGWNFGDGSPVTFANDPAHAYAGTGPYNVILYSTLAGWTHTCIDDHNVNIGGAGLPIAAVTPNVSGAMVDFINTSSGATSVSWNFGDGATSTATSPTHWYSSNGTFVVVLIVSNACGADTLLVSVDILCDFPDASFGYDQPTGTLLTSFTDSSSGDITTYFWDFGDGGTSASANPYHTYPAYGDYLVTLIISGPCGNDTLTDTVHITAPVGLQDAASRGMMLFPNPAQTQVQVAGLPAGNCELILTDLSGRVLLRRETGMASAGGVLLHLEGLPSGSYVVTALSGEGRKSALLHIAR